MQGKKVDQHKRAMPIPASNPVRSSEAIENEHTNDYQRG